MKSEDRVNEKLSDIKEKYPSLDFDSAVVISYILVKQRIINSAHI